MAEELSLALRLNDVERHPDYMVFALEPVMATEYGDDVRDLWMANDTDACLAVRKRLLDVRVTVQVDRASHGDHFYQTRLTVRAGDEVDLWTAESMVCKLKTIWRKLDKMVRDDGPPKSAGQCVLRVMAAIGTRHFLRDSPRDAGFYQSVEHDAPMVCHILDAIVTETFVAESVAA